MPIADWPASRADFASLAAPADGWVLRPMPGSDAVPGLDETEVIDGVPVTTRVVANDPTAAVRWQTTVRAPARGAVPAVRARPGYHFLLAGLRRDDELGDPVVDDRYIIHADDPPWTRWWLGPVERAALLATYAPEAVAPFTLVVADAHVELTAGDLPSRHVLDAARQAAAWLATRADRAADTWRGHAAALGARVRGDVWGPGGDFALVAERGAALITIDTVTRTDLDAGPARLRTRVHAPRRAAHRAALAAWAPDLARRHRPRDAGLGAAVAAAGLDGRTDDAAWAAPRLAACSAPLVRARPDAVAVTAVAATLWWEGVVDDPARLAAAVDAVACLAVELAAPGAGPYR